MAGNDPFLFGYAIGQNGALAEQRTIIKEMDDELGEAAQKLQAQAAEIARLKMQLAVAEADAEGRSAQVDALITQHPDTPLMKDSGVAWQSKNGNKTVVRRIYEQAFDAAARKRGIENPETRRTN